MNLEQWTEIRDQNGRVLFRKLEKVTDLGAAGIRHEQAQQWVTCPACSTPLADPTHLRPQCMCGHSPLTCIHCSRVCGACGANLGRCCISGSPIKGTVLCFGCLSVLEEQLDFERRVALHRLTVEETLKVSQHRTSILSAPILNGFPGIEGLRQLLHLREFMRLGRLQNKLLGPGAP